MNYTLAFDVYGTLIDTSGVFDYLENLIGSKANSFVEAWRQKQLEYSFRRGLMAKYTDFSICTKQALEFCCQSFKVDLKLQEKTDLLNLYSALPIFPDVKLGLEDLRATGHRLFAFSNGSSAAVTKLLTNSQVINYFEGIVSVEKTETFKPNPLVYEYFNRTTNSKKSNTWLISGNSFDVIGAISYGMRSAWLKRTKTCVFDPWNIKPTIIINELQELRSALNHIDV